MTAMSRFPPMNQIIVGHAASVMAGWPSRSIDNIICSPPYWTAVTYSIEHSWRLYEDYLADMQRVWVECARVLRPNGKLCINAMIMPVPQPKPNRTQEPRRLLDIPVDIQNGILAKTDLRLFEKFTWQKQTSPNMFGAGLRPGNNIANNTTESITIYVKPGKPRKFASSVIAANRMSGVIKRDLIQQVWFMYPEDVKRRGGHPAPFPEILPARLIKLFTFGAVDDFPGEIVLDPFCGGGTTCAVAKMMGHRWIGIDINEHYVEMARERVEKAVVGNVPLLLVGTPPWPSTEGLEATKLGFIGRAAGEAKHKRRTYGRKVPMPAGAGKS